jgi:hypothetical protein
MMNLKTASLPVTVLYSLSEICFQGDFFFGLAFPQITISALRCNTILSVNIAGRLMLANNRFVSNKEKRLMIDFM